jgi:hypothetical protein
MALWLYQTRRQAARPLLPVHIQAHNSLLFTPARWSPDAADAAADAADVPPPPQPAAD